MPLVFTPSLLKQKALTQTHSIAVSKMISNLGQDAPASSGIIWAMTQLLTAKVV